MKALLIVDVQNDFCPGGALAVPNGDRVVPVINGLMDHFGVIVASRDWHPRDSMHFKAWPVHCVQGTRGAEFHPGLQSKRIGQQLLKGTGIDDDGYSAYEATNADLESYLKQHQVDELYVVGLATDYCVKHSALDAARRGLRTIVVTDAVAAVDVRAGDGDRAIAEMKAAGVEFVFSRDIHT